MSLSDFDSHCCPASLASPKHWLGLCNTPAPVLTLVRLTCRHILEWLNQVYWTWGSDAVQQGDVYIRSRTWRRMPQTLDWARGNIWILAAVCCGWADNLLLEQPCGELSHNVLQDPVICSRWWHNTLHGHVRRSSTYNMTSGISCFSNLPEYFSILIAFHKRGYLNISNTTFPTSLSAPLDFTFCCGQIWDSYDKTG
jgi:hypothetical protein